MMIMKTRRKNDGVSGWKIWYWQKDVMKIKKSEVEVCSMRICPALFIAKIFDMSLFWGRKFSPAATLLSMEFAGSS